MTAPTEPAGDRRIPFTLRVAIVWANPSAAVGDGAMYYWRQAPLTGALASTGDERDVSFSDLEAR
jgi:hypothetical protein